MARSARPEAYLANVRLHLLCDRYADHPRLADDLDLHAEVTSSIPKTSLASAHGLNEADLAILLGPLENHERTIELAGELRHSLRRGSTVVIAYDQVVDGPIEVLVRRLAEPIGIQRHPTVGPVTSAHPAFESYFISFGSSATYFGDLAPGSVTLGTLDLVSDSQTAFFLEREQGQLYVVPFHVGSLMDSRARLVHALFSATRNYQQERTMEVPEYLSDWRLPGEEELLAEICEQRIALAHKEAQAEHLARFRLLLASLSGDALETLVIDTLNQVLEGSGLVAQDRVDRSEEDFWIVDSDREVAIAEVKGVGTGVRRDHINKLDDHRAAHGRDVDELPGLLVVNQFRNDDNLGRRLERIASGQVAHLVRQNVLLLRTVDLYNLLAAQMRGDSSVASTLAGQLRQGGGWLEVARDGEITMHR